MSLYFSKGHFDNIVWNLGDISYRKLKYLRSFGDITVPSLDSFWGQTGLKCTFLCASKHPEDGHAQYIKQLGFTVHLEIFQDLCLIAVLITNDLISQLWHFCCKSIKETPFGDIKLY